MKNQIFAVWLCACCTAMPSNTEPAIFNFEQSSLGFEVLSDDRTIAGFFGAWTADIVYDHDEPETASFRVVVETSSVTLSDQIAQTMVGTASWLASEDFPTAEFTSGSVTTMGNGSFRVAGELTLRGFVVPVELTVVIDGSTETTVADVSGHLSRSDFAIGSSFGPEIVDDLVTLNATVVLSK